MVKISMKAKHEIIESQRKNYKKLSKKEKSSVITSICRTTGLSRDRAIRLLKGSKKLRNGIVKRNRKPTYGSEVLKA